MCRGIDERIDNLQLLGNRPGPSVRDDERQRIFMFRTNVNEMNVQPIDLGDEMRQGVQSCLALAPFVVRAPIARECLTGRELYALRCVRDRFPFRPLCRVYTPAQFGKFCFRKIHIKPTNCICLLAASLCSTGLGHGVLLLSSFGFFRLRTWRLLFLRPRRTSSIGEWERPYHKTDAGSIVSEARAGRDARTSRVLGAFDTAT